jgi:hypothetical protein
MSKFSNVPLATIAIDELKASRFLLPDTKELPYRDEAGLVNVDLCRHSHAQVRDSHVLCSEELAATLAKWLKHAEAWLAANPTATWERGKGGVWRSATGDLRPEPGIKKPARSPEKANASPAMPMDVQAPARGPGDPADFKAEYAKSGRSSCKKCKEGIAKDDLRLARCVQSPHFDGRMDTWYHFDCFFSSKWAPSSHTEIVGCAVLRPVDQHRIKAKASSSAPSAGAALGDGELQAEYASSGRAGCRHCGEKIMKGEPRVAHPGASESRPG